MIAAVVAGAIGVFTIFGIFFSDADDIAARAGAVESAIIATELVLVIGVVAAVVAALRGLVVNPAGLRNAVIGIVALGVIVAVAFGMADGSDYELYNTDEETAYYVSAGLNAFYIIGLLTLVSVLYSAVARIIK